MMGTIKAEARKLLSVRSTYFILLICLALEFLFAFYANGIKLNPDMTQPDFLASQVVQAINLLGLFSALIAVLFVTHEYRYNTILYTLTAARGRGRVLLAKFLVISVFAVVLSLVLGALSPTLAALGAKIAHHHLAPQHFEVWNLTWRTLVIGWGGTVYGLIIAFLVRAQPGAVAALFLIPSTVENIVGILLKKNQDYLPFSAINAVTQKSSISMTTAAFVVLAYVLGGLLISYAFLVRRDAN